MMKIVVITPLLQIQSLLAYSFDVRFDAKREISNLQANFADARALRQRSVGFAVHFLQQEIELSCRWRRLPGLMRRISLA